MPQPPAGLDQFLAQSARGPADSPDPSPPSAPAGLDQFLQSDVYGTPGQMALAGVEGLARGATLGASDFLAAKLSSPEAVKAREEENLGLSLGGNMLGGAGLIALTGGAAGPAEAALLGAKGAEGASTLAQLGARAGGYAAEGALFGAGNAVSDAALGDPDLNAQKVLAHIGMGAALGAGLGVLSKGVEAVPAMLRTSEVAESAIGSGVSHAEPALKIIDPELKGVQPTSFEDMAARVKQATQFGGQTLEVPEKGVLSDAASRVDMMNPVHPLQLESLENQEARNLYNIAREMPGKEGEAIRGYEAIQKNELLSKASKTIDDLSPGVKPTPDAVEGGNRAIEAFTKQYQAEKKALSPAFRELSEMSAGQNFDHLPGVISRFSDAVPGVARMFNTEAESGVVSFHPYKSSWGIDKSTYNAVKEAVEALKENPETLQDLANIRRGLDQHVDVLAQGQAPSQIRALKASMMDYMQGIVDAQTKDAPALRGTFKKWAINEQERGVIEKAFGASVGSPEFGAISKIKPELIGDKIFSNTANVKAAKAILEPKEFNQILANWISEAKAASTDKGVFSSNKFHSFMKRNQDALNEAFLDNPSGLQRLKDLTTMMRILPDAASANPAGTAKTLLGHLKGHDTVIGLLKGIGGAVKEKFEEGQVRSQVAAALAGKADQAAKLKSVQGIVKQVEKKMTGAAKAIYESPASRGAAISGAVSLSKEEFKTHTDRVKALSSDPHAMLDHMSGSTSALYGAAPNVTQGIHNTMIAGVQFLASKLPRPMDEMTLSPEWEPSRSQRYQFETYFRAVNDPLSVLEDVKNNSVTGESLEALQAVNPHLLQEMRLQVMSQMNLEEAKKLPYPSKLSLSKFLGQPLDQNMLPASVMASQVAMNSPSLSNQSSPQNGRKSTLGGLKQLNLAGRAATKTQEQGTDA